LTADKALLKPATRLLGVAESGLIGASQTILGGVVIRKDLLIDGLVWNKVTLRGTDSTRAIIQMLMWLARADLNGLMLHGTVVAGYNIIDMDQLFKSTSLPIISVTKQPHEELKVHLKSTFPSEWKERWEIAQRNGEIKSMEIEPNSCVYVQFKGCEWDVVKGVIKGFTYFGGIPEPIRVARMLARALIETKKRI
jgi:endonuclease V-like protein UPF0215 family